MKAIRPLLILIGILFSCSATNMVTSWNDKNAQEKKYQRVGIVAITPNTENRATAEDAVASQLRAKGINAFATFNTFPFAGKIGEIDLPDSIIQRKIREKVRDNKFDAIITMTVLDKQQQQEYVEGSSISIGAPVYDYTFGGYYSYAYQTVYTSGYYKTTSSYFLETNMYDIATEKLIYTAQTKTIDPESISKEAPNFARVIVDDMMTKKVLAK
jgi:hypothetical protein